MCYRDDLLEVRIFFENKVVTQHNQVLEFSVDDLKCESLDLYVFHNHPPHNQIRLNDTFKTVYACDVGEKWC